MSIFSVAGKIAKGVGKIAKKHKKKSIAAGVVGVGGTILQKRASVVREQEKVKAAEDKKLRKEAFDKRMKAQRKADTIANQEARRGMVGLEALMDKTAKAREDLDKQIQNLYKQQEDVFKGI